MQSCSRAVVLPLLAFTIQIIAPTVSLADEGVPQQPVLVDRSEPGVLVFDGSDNRSFLPLLDEIREFPDLASYLEFVYSAFNFAVDEVVQEGEASSLNIIQYGTLYTYTEDLTNLIPVSNAVATLIGGRYGKVIVDGTEYCIDSDRCEESVDPYTLQEMEFSGGAPSSSPR